jgi:hypothetical protein
MKGTVTSDVTTWVDPSGHRILKSHMTQSNTGTLDLGSSRAAMKADWPD